MYIWAGRGKTPFKKVFRFPVEFESNSTLSRRWCTFPPIERLPRLPRLMNKPNSSWQSIKSDCTSGEDGILVVGVSRDMLLELEYYKNAHFRAIIIFLKCKLCIRLPYKCSASIDHIASSGIRLSVPLRCLLLHALYWSHGMSSHNLRLIISHRWLKSGLNVSAFGAFVLPLSWYLVHLKLLLWVAENFGRIPCFNLKI